MPFDWLLAIWQAAEIFRNFEGLRPITKGVNNCSSEQSDEEEIPVSVSLSYVGVYGLWVCGSVSTGLWVDRGSKGLQVYGPWVYGPSGLRVYGSVVY
jgi:hypothetical protein